ncbi:MAG: monovalent cation/H+ antiporter subunit D family protein [Arenicellales bacterium]|nr:monovalent cation/H+ antiporter subunit D family protein [Arenicellales bacterium]MDE0977566.1 monovalent cation/H+ antiporter subunit D family protein [Arenicellales bacterium]
MSDQVALIGVVVVPLLGALAVMLVGSRPNLREAMSLGAGVVLLALVVRLLPRVLSGDWPATVLAEPIPGLSLAFSAEPLGVLFGLIASFLWIVTTVYSIGYMRGHGEAHQTRFYAFFAVAMGCTMGVAFADNLFTLFVFYELLTLSTYPLVTHAGTREARQGGRIYLGILMATSMGFLLLAVVWTWQLTGNLRFTSGGILAGAASPLVIGVLFALYVFGIGKAALMPFHRWLPAAMVAPTPVSALLHAVAVVKAGVFAILKITVYIFGLDLLRDTGVTDWLLWVAAFTILVASVIALRQDNLKARLAYSTISQLSYIVMGALLVNSTALAGSTLHLATHAFGKITLFFCAGAILVASHKTKVSELDGLGRQMPWTMGAFFLASLSIVGLPPMGGMWSKWYLALGAIDAGYAVLVGVLMVSTLLNIAYLIPVPIRAFFGKADAGSEIQIREAPIACLLAMGVTVAGCVALFFNPTWIVQLARQFVE